MKQIILLQYPSSLLPGCDAQLCVISDIRYSMLTSCFDQQTQPLAFSQIAITSVASKGERQAFTDRTSHTNETANQFRIYRQLRQARKELQHYKQYYELDDNIRAYSESVDCRHIFTLLDNFRESFRMLNERQQTREEIPALFHQLRRDLVEVDTSASSSPCMQSSGCDSSSNATNSLGKLELIEALYQKLAYIDQLEKHVLKPNNSHKSFTALQKSTLPSPMPHSSVSILQFKCFQSCQAETQTQSDGAFIEVIKAYKHIYKRCISSCNLIWKLMYKLISAEAEFLKEYEYNNNALLVWYSRFKFKPRRCDLGEANQYMRACNQKAAHFGHFMETINRILSSPQ